MFWVLLKPLELAHQLAPSATAGADGVSLAALVPLPDYVDIMAGRIFSDVAAPGPDSNACSLVRTILSLPMPAGGSQGRLTNGSRKLKSKSRNANCLCISL
jgi:hypothetical protein